MKTFSFFNFQKFNKFIIKKGGHYSKPLFKTPIFNFKSEISCYCMFTSSCLYELKSNKNQINKLIGFSNGWHHHNSIRVGWVAENMTEDLKVIELFWYSYEKGKRYSKHLGYVQVDEIFSLHINNINGYYTITFKDSDGNITTETSNIKIRKYWGYNLYPYFGGKEKSPHEIKIYLKRF